jgi:nucleotide-binding universal stress UspA family protein
MRGIIVGVNGSGESDEALDWALAEAASRGASLTALIAWQPGSRSPEPADFAAMVDRKREECLTALDRAFQRAREADGEGPPVDAQVHVAQGPAADALLAASEDADMVVLGRRQRGRLGRLVLGSVSSTVVEQARVPVTVVRDRGDGVVAHLSPSPHLEDEGTVPRIVVGVDTSPASVEALRHANEVAARTGAVLEAIYAWQITTLAPLPGSWGWAPPFDDYAKFAGERLDAAIETAGLTLPADQLARNVVHGHAAQSLVEASTRAGRLVVGARGLGGFDRLMLGSVSRQVLDYAACPVTVIRT